MNEVTPLSQFKDALLNSKAVLRLIKQTYRKETDAMLTQFRSGAIDELLELVEEERCAGGTRPRATIEGAGPDDDTFSIEVYGFGPVFWISAAEFDDIGYFGSVEEARDYATFEYDAYITELAERRKEERAEQRRAKKLEREQQKAQGVRPPPANP